MKTREEFIGMRFLEAQFSDRKTSAAQLAKQDVTVPGRLAVVYMTKSKFWTDLGKVPEKPAPIASFQAAHLVGSDKRRGHDASQRSIQRRSTDAGGRRAQAQKPKEMVSGQARRPASMG
jgi:hypothetical protein